MNQNEDECIIRQGKKINQKVSNLTLAVLCKRVVDSGHSIKYNKHYYRFVNRAGNPIYFNKGLNIFFLSFLL